MASVEIELEGGVKEIAAGGVLRAAVSARGEGAGRAVLGWERPGGGGEVVWEGELVWEGGEAGVRRGRLERALPTGPTCARGELGATWYLEARVGDGVQRAYFRLMPPGERAAGEQAPRDLARVLAPGGDEADVLSLGVYGGLSVAVGVALMAVGLWSAAPIMGALGVGLSAVGGLLLLKRGEVAQGSASGVMVSVGVEPAEVSPGQQVRVVVDVLALRQVTVRRVQGALVEGERTMRFVHRRDVPDPVEVVDWRERGRVVAGAQAVGRALAAGERVSVELSVEVPASARPSTPGGVGVVWQGWARVELEGGGEEEWGMMRVRARGAEGAEHVEPMEEGGGEEERRGGGW